MSRQFTTPICHCTKMQFTANASELREEKNSSSKRDPTGPYQQNFQCWFTHTLRRFPPQDWALEQRWMSILLPLLLLFNNPIFPMIFLVNSSVPAILDAIFQATFLCGLMFFWLSAYHGLRQVCSQLRL